ncbi:MAG: hypothetical protein ACJ762_12285 [Solirubrobacteraceae bacterium]
MKAVLTAGVVFVLALTGCGSSDDGGGLEGPDIGKAKSFEIAGLDQTGPIQAGKPVDLKFHIEQPEGGALTKFKTGSGPHTGVHLIMVRKDLSAIIHRHPPVGAGGALSQTVTFPSGGQWHVVTDVYPDLGENTLQNFQLTSTLDVEGSGSANAALPPFTSEVSAGGNRFVMKRPTGLKALKPQFLDIDVRDANGRPATFEQYYGALAHAIFFRAGSLAYFHTHVCGAGAQACAASIGGSSVTGKSTTPGKLKVGMLLPSPGTWKLFLQAKINGTVVTAPYTLKVS